MEGKGASEPPRTSHRRNIESGSTEAGFALIEIVCTLAMVALLAAILLPRVGTGTSRPRLEAYAYELATLLKADRTAAIRNRRSVAARVDSSERVVHSGWSHRVVRLPDDVLFNAVLPDWCNGRPGASTIEFFASGMSCGGAIILRRFSSQFEVRVNWLTGGIDIVDPGTH